MKLLHQFVQKYFCGVYLRRFVPIVHFVILNQCIYWCFVHVNVGFLQSPVNDRLFGHYSRILKFRFGAVRLITKNGSWRIMKSGSVNHSGSVRLVSIRNHYSRFGAVTGVSDSPSLVFQDLDQFT